MHSTAINPLKAEAIEFLAPELTEVRTARDGWHDIVGRTLWPATPTRNGQFSSRVFWKRPPVCPLIAGHMANKYIYNYIYISHIIHMVLHVPSLVRVWSSEHTCPRMIFAVTSHKRRGLQEQLPYNQISRSLTWIRHYQYQLLEIPTILATYWMNVPPIFLQNHSRVGSRIGKKTMQLLALGNISAANLSPESRKPVIVQTFSSIRCFLAGGWENCWWHAPKLFRFVAVYCIHVV